jgi:hypothetical protein
MLGTEYHGFDISAAGETYQGCSKQQQKKKKQQQQQQRPAKQPHQRSNQSETGSVAEQEPALGGSAAAASQGRCQARSQKKTKKQLNVSNLRARLHMGVQRRSMKLRAAPGGATDVVVFVHFPLGLNGKLRTVFQGVTKQQAGAILGALIEMTGWDDERLEAKYQELVSGAVVHWSVSTRAVPIAEIPLCSFAAHGCASTPLNTIMLYHMKLLFPRCCT